ncbi:MAG TPA: SDR family oxidoreductase [Anaerolineae bacterium]|nr:SDR family oxidoreductase [Anaerolineae bacterium]
MLDFAGQVVLITGGTSGIGLAAAELFAGQGAAVMLAGRSADKGEDAVAALAAAGAQAAFVRADVRDEDGVRYLVAETLSEFGRLDVLVNSAGVINRILLTELEQPDWDVVMDTNLRGVYLLCKHVLPVLFEQRSGAVVNVASYLGAYGARETSPAYNASKAGVVSLTRSLALQAGPHGVRVNAVCPGFVVTPLNEGIVRNAPDPVAKEQEMSRPYPLGRLGRPGDVAPAILFLASSEAAWITGSALVVDGGLTAR